MGSEFGVGVSAVMPSRSIGVSRLPLDVAASVRPSGSRHDHPELRLVVYGPLSLTLRYESGVDCPRCLRPFGCRRVTRLSKVACRRSSLDLCPGRQARLPIDGISGERSRRQIHVIGAPAEG